MARTTTPQGIAKRSSGPRGRNTPATKKTSPPKKRAARKTADDTGTVTGRKPRARTAAAGTTGGTAQNAGASAPPRPPGASGPTGGTQVTIRHYCQGIGDCHLLRFPKRDGGTFTLLIDCGVHSSVSGGSDFIGRVVDDILELTGGWIDLLVITHEHWDHLSGFFSAKEKFASPQFKVQEVWAGWTENPADPQAQQLDKFKSVAVKALQDASDRLQQAGTLTPHLASLRDSLPAVLGFHVVPDGVLGFGLKGAKVREARDLAIGLKKNNVKYMEPKGPPLSLAGLDNLRVYVLGPPRDAALLGLTERASEMYALGGLDGWPMAAALSNALGSAGDDAASSVDLAAPFDGAFGCRLESMLAAMNSGSKPVCDADTAALFRDHYAGPATDAAGSTEGDQTWRRIDMDWLGISTDLAMQLDDRTNNTSLALAFEFVDTGRVMLFAADAQVGNWLSWQDLKWDVDEKTVTGPDLLARTVHYKVGHHGSHNATLQKKGLELMVNPDLSAFIPTNARDAQKVGWGEMPFDSILKELERRTSGRVIRADDAWIGGQTLPSTFKEASGSLKAVRPAPKGQDGLYVELDIG